MNYRVWLGMLVASYVVAWSVPLAAQDSYPLTAAEKYEYHACLYRSYINNYCNFNAGSPFPETFHECVVTNRAARIPIGFPFWDFGVEAKCRELVLSHRAVDHLIAK